MFRFHGTITVYDLDTGETREIDIPGWIPLAILGAIILIIASAIAALQ